MKVSPYIFREYDIRGKIGFDFTEDVVFAIGKAYGTTVRRLGGKGVVCGRDGRLSSPSLQQALMDGIRSTGISVVDIGVTPTPVMYFSLFRLENIDGGIQVTGSHNPPEFNGLKICVGKDTIYGEKIKDLYRLIEKQDFEEGQGALEALNIHDDYLNYLKENINISRPLRVALDAGHGV